MARLALLAVGPVLILAGLALTPWIARGFEAPPAQAVDTSVDVFADRATISFRPAANGRYEIALTARMCKSFEETYCLLRAPTDYWSQVVCDRTLRFSADVLVREDFRTVSERKMRRSPAGITRIEEGGTTYLKRHLGDARLQGGHFYTLVVQWNAVDGDLRDCHPRLLVRLAETDIDSRSWLMLLALLLAPTLILAGAAMALKGIRGGAGG